MKTAGSAGKALITGSSSGMGYEYARILASLGYDIVLASNEKEKLENIGKEFEEKFNITTWPVYVDLSLQDSAEELYDFCRKCDLQIDILINNAGFFVFGEVVNTPPERVADMINLHVLSYTLLCRLFGKDMKERRRGYILNMSSLSYVMPYPGIALYAATKRYLKNFSRALRSEMMDYNVGVTCVCPGAVATNLFDRNVINYRKAMRYGIMMKADKVAEIAVKAMFRRKFLVIPGFMNKIFLFFLFLIPPGIILQVRRHTRLLPVEKE